MSLLLTTGATWAARLVAAGAQVLVLRFVGMGTGVDGLAFFVAMLGLTPWFLLADGGLGQAAQNRVAGAVGRDADPHAVGGVLCRWALVLQIAWLLIWWPVSGLVWDWLGNFGFLSGRREEGLMAFRVIGICTMTMAVSGVVWRIFFGENRGWIASLAVAMSVSLGLLCAWAATLAQASAPVILACWCGPSALCALACVSIRAVAGLRAKEPLTGIWKEAGKFWVFAVLSVLTLSLDYVILASVASEYEIAGYGVMQRVIGFGLGLYGAFLSAAAPGITMAFSRGALNSINRHLFRMIGFVLVSGVLATLALLMAGRVVVELIAGHALPVGSACFVLAGLYLTLRLWTDTMACVLLATGRMRVLLWIVPVQALVSCSALLMLVPMWGAAGAFAALDLSFLTTVAWVLPIAVYKILREKTFADE